MLEYTEPPLPGVEYPNSSYAIPEISEDEEGLEETISNLQKEHEIILLRDGKSTYMKGERRHPKWMLLRNTKDYNFIVLDVKGKNSYTYRLGAGPILDGSKLGNRAV